MKKLVLILIVLSVAAMSSAQNIRGKIIDIYNNPVEFATIVLQTSDSVYVSSTYTDSLGIFSFNSGLKSYRLIVQHLMFNISDNIYGSPEAGIIKLQNNEYGLSEVVVKGEQAVIKVIDGRMTYDMPRLLKDKAVNNAYESVLQLPGVREQNNAITLAGASSLTIIMNGKPTTMSPEQLTELLKNTPKERIQNVEVMYSAPPQYHARGAVINLILSKGSPQASAFQGQINTGYEQRHYAGYNGGLTLLYNTPRFSIDFMYSFGYANHRSGLKLYSDHLFNGTLHHIKQYNNGYMRNPVHNIRLGNDFDLKNNNKLSLVYTAQVIPWKKSSQKSKGTFSDSDNLKENDIPVQMHNISFNYSSGFGLKLGADYTFYKNHAIQSYHENMEEKKDAFAARSKQDINKVSFYADQSHNLKDDWILNYGAKFIYTSDKSSQQYRSLLNKDLSEPNTNSKLSEYIYNLYIGFEKSFNEKLSASLSLSGEYYKHKDFDKWSLFPVFQITYISNPEHFFQLSMSSDKVYPDYWEMINSISYVNGYVEIHGNTDLRPYKDYSLQLSYILKSKYIFTAYANYQDDYFAQLPYQSSEKLALIYKTTNFDYSEKVGVNIILPFKLGSVIDSRLTLTGFYDKVKSRHFHDTSFNNKGFAFYSSLNNTFNISSKPDIKAELAGAYMSRSIQGPSELSKLYKVDAGIKWSFNQNKAELRLKANDIFNSWSPDSWSMKFDRQNVQMHIIPDSRYISLSFSYKFGGYKQKERKAVDTSRFVK